VFQIHGATTGSAGVEISVLSVSRAECLRGPEVGAITRRDYNDQQRHSVQRYILFPDIGMRLEIYYGRTNQHAFDETYKAICNSPRIE
jgi:hypothetical protein